MLDGARGMPDRGPGGDCLQTFPKLESHMGLSFERPKRSGGMIRGALKLDLMGTGMKADLHTFASLQLALLKIVVICRND